MLLFALIALLIMFIGALFTFRGAMMDTSLTDKFSQRQKNVQASDLALQWVANQIAVQGSAQPLEVAAVGQPWYLNVPPAQAITPTPAYWSTCMASPTATDTCGQVTLANHAPQQSWAFVEPTGRIDPYACHVQNMTALYYDVWVHTVDPRTNVAADVESIYKLCVITGQS